MGYILRRVQTTECVAESWSKILIKLVLCSLFNFSTDYASSNLPAKIKTAFRHMYFVDSLHTCGASGFEAQDCRPSLHRKPLVQAALFAVN